MDFISDNNPKHLEKVKTLLGEFPDYVKNANVSQKPKIARGSFANSVDKEFPMNDKPNIFLSYAYLKSASKDDIAKGTNIEFFRKNRFKEIENKLFKSAQILGITEDLENIDKALLKFANDNKPDPAEKFALVIDFEKEGGVKYYYPIDSREELEKSARDLANDIERFPIEAFRTASHRIVKKAKEYGVDLKSLPTKVSRTGADKDFNEKIASHAANQRKRLFGEEAGKIYEDIVKSAANDPKNVDSYVNLFVDLDRINKVAYTNGMLNPYEAFFSGVEKAEIEKAADSHVLLAEVPVPIEAIKESAELIDKSFNKDDKEKLLPLVDMAEEGGIKTAMVIMDLDPDLQKRYLKVLSES